MNGKRVKIFCQIKQQNQNLDTNEHMEQSAIMCSDYSLTDYKQVST